MSYTRRTDDFIASLNLPEAYRVGGSVRDEILGRRCKDADYVVRGITRDELKRLVRKTGADVSDLKLRDGRKVGVRAHKRGLGLMEIMLPRTEVKRALAPGENERQAFEIVTNPDLTLGQDAIRRDLTINALYKVVPNEHVNGWGDTRYGDMGIVDPTGMGVTDIENKIIRTTYANSFRDDPLRILRALRFRSVLGFALADETRAQMEEHANAVTGLTAKGVSGTALDELSKLLMGRNVAAALRDARDTGALAVLLPELAEMISFEQESQYHDMTTDEHTFAALDVAAGLDCNLRVRFALLFHDAGKPASAWMGDDGHLHFYESKDHPGSEDHAVISARLARKALKRLNAERPIQRDVPLLVERHMVSLDMRTKAAKVRTWRCDLGDDLLADLFRHRLCDVMGKSVVDYEAVRAVARLEKIREEAEHAGVPASAKELPISGHDLMAMGLEGPKIGAVQKQLLHEVVSQPERNDREWLLGRARKLAARA